MGGREAPLDIYGRLETEAGLPVLRGAAKTLTGEIESIEDILRGIEPDVGARTRESLVTEAQRRGIVQERAKPFLKRLGEFGTALSRIAGRITAAEQGIAMKVQLAMKGQEMELEPHQLYFSVLTDRNARMLTGFTADRQTKLDMLWDKLQRERQLSDMEWQLANELGAEERGYMEQLQTAAASAGVTLVGDETPEQLLGMIGSAAREEIEWGRAQAGKGTAGERAQGEALTRLKNDINNWASFDDLVAAYQEELSISQIKSEYNAGPAAATWGPAAESPEDIAKLKKGWYPESEEENEKSSVGYWTDKAYSYEDAKVMAELYR